MNFLAEMPLSNLIVGCITILIVVTIVFYFLKNKDFSIGKNGISIDMADEKRMSDKIPAIDAEMKAACREALTEARKHIIGNIALTDKTKILLVENQITDVMKQRIRENDLVEKFIEKTMLQHWIERCTAEVMSQVKYVEKFSDLEIVNKELEPSIVVIVNKLYQIFYDYVLRGVKEKIKYYTTLKPTEKVKELISRNQGYLQSLKQVRYS